MTDYQSWGKFPKVKQQIIKIRDRSADLSIPKDQTVLPFGLGRSYGDSCLNDDNTILDICPLDRFINFDPGTGILRAESGVSLEEILKCFVPHGWFIPVSPGTKYVTLGGAIANDIHGKNHHRAGTFGCHVMQFELLRSTGERLICSPLQNKELYCATIGGLGLTGLITWADIRLVKIKSQYVDTVSIKFDNLSEFFSISEANDSKYEFSVSWVDCTASGSSLGRGIYMAGNFSERLSDQLSVKRKELSISFPIEAPAWVLNKYSIRAFNWLYYNKQLNKSISKLSHYEPFFYPLDAIKNWNRMYGKRGFFQYQMAVPFEKDAHAVTEIFKLISAFGKASFLAVLKSFGHVKSPGMLSFPIPGITLALDFPNEGKETFALMQQLDQLVVQAGGKVYPAKDARMSPESFQRYYPQYREFSKYIDPKFSSSFWRRVTQSV